MNAILRDRRFGREAPPERAPAIPDHLRPFYAVEAHSMLELEPPRHTRLRGLVLRAFTSRRIAALAPEIAGLAHQLIDQLPPGPFDFLRHFGQPLPVIIIARLLGAKLTESLGQNVIIDNRPGATLTQPLDNNYQRGLIWPYVERNQAVFMCPNGLDLDPTRLEQLANDVLRAALDWTQALDERSVKPSDIAAPNSRAFLA